MIKPGQYVDLNDGYGFQKVATVNTYYFRLEAGGEYRIDAVHEVRDAEEVELPNET